MPESASTVRGYFQWRGHSDDEQEFVESPDGHYVITAEQKARWDRALSSMAEMQAEIGVVETEQAPPPQPPSGHSRFIPEVWATALEQAMVSKFIHGQEGP